MTELGLWMDAEVRTTPGSAKIQVPTVSHEDNIRRWLWHLKEYISIAIMLILLGCLELLFNAATSVRKIRVPELMLYPCNEMTIFLNSCAML